MTSEIIRIGTRGSDLALWQARWVQQTLTNHVSGLRAEVCIIKTTGDKVLDTPLSRIGDKGLFTREIESALLKGEIDCAVHSLKDLPTQLPEGLVLGAVTEREDVRDVFLPRRGNPIRSLFEQPHHSRVATGSLRRKSQLSALRPDFTIVDIRGNLNTRLLKLEESNWAGMILAMAGVTRLGWNDRIGEVIPTDRVLPAVGQGALGIEIREGDQEVRSLIGVLNHPATERSTAAERSLLKALEGGCQVPIGAYGRLIDGIEHTLRLEAMVGSLDGSRVVRGEIIGPPGDAAVLGARLADELLSRGARAILDEIRSEDPDA
jgi:hydroxymethylbilane synthase